MALKAKDNLRHLRKHFMRVFYEISTSLFWMFSRFCDILQCSGSVQSRALWLFRAMGIMEGTLHCLDTDWMLRGFTSNSLRVLKSHDWRQNKDKGHKKRRLFNILVKPYWHHRMACFIWFVYTMFINRRYSLINIDWKRVILTPGSGVYKRFDVIAATDSALFLPIHTPLHNESTTWWFLKSSHFCILKYRFF